MSGLELACHSKEFNLWTWQWSDIFYQLCIICNVCIYRNEYNYTFKIQVQEKWARVFDTFDVLKALPRIGSYFNQAIRLMHKLNMYRGRCRNIAIKLKIKPRNTERKRQNHRAQKMGKSAQHTMKKRSIKITCHVIKGKSHTSHECSTPRFPIFFTVTPHV